MKSSSSSGQPPKRSLKRALKRGCSFEHFAAPHMPYAWAAYCRGLLGDICEPGATPAEFRAKMEERTATIIWDGGDLFVLKNPTGVVVGFVALSVAQPPGAVRQLTPHVLWTPEASPRNRLECALRFVSDLRQDGHVLVVASEPNWRFFERLSSYGVIRYSGLIRKYFADGLDAKLYQGVMYDRRTVGSG